MYESHLSYSAITNVIANKDQPTFPYLDEWRRRGMHITNIVTPFHCQFSSLPPATLPPFPLPSTWNLGRRGPRDDCAWKLTEL